MKFDDGVCAFCLLRQERLESFRSEYPLEVFLCPKVCYYPSLIRRFYEFLPLQGIFVKIHRKDKRLYNLAVGLHKDEEQEIAIDTTVKPDLSFDDEFLKYWPRKCVLLLMI